MTLTELMLASVLFMAAATASLQVWAMAIVATANHSQQQQQLDRVDAALMAVDHRLRQQALLGAATADCSLAAQQLVAVVQELPVAPDLQRQLERVGGGDQVMVSVGAAALDQPRRRLYSPAAMNLCGGLAAAPDSEAAELDSDAGN